MPTRRQFLAGLGAGLAGSALPGVAHALPAFDKPYNILQIYLAGAIAHRDTLWCRAGDPDPSLFEPEGVVPDPLPSAERVLFGTDDHGDEIWLGRGFHPLAGHLDRTRLISMSMPLGVHEIGWAYAHTGTRLGRASAQSLGSRIQAVAAPGVPTSWVLDGIRTQMLTHAATRIGALPAHARPLVLPTGSEALMARLNRASKANTDDLTALYRDLYADRLVHTGEPVRSAAFATYDDALDRMRSWSDLYNLLMSPDIATYTAGEKSFYSSNPFTRTIELGARLITHGGIRHVCTFASLGNLPDTLDSHGGFGQDPVFHSQHHNSVLWGACDAVREAVDGGDLNLDDTIVLFHSEFGRESAQDGSDHWIDGYVAVVMGGPVQSRGRKGWLDTNGTPGKAHGGIEPQDLVCAMALAAGADGTTFPDGEPTDAFALREAVFGAWGQIQNP